MNKNFLLIILLISKVVYANNFDCEKIINKYSFNEPIIDSLELGLEYRSKYFSNEKQLEAFCLIDYSRKLGNIEAEPILAQFYESGDVVKKDMLKAFNMTKNAVDKGSVFALNNLASYYLHGQVVSKNFEKSIFYYQKAINEGNSFAKIGLGSMYFNGIGVNKNIDTAITLTKEAALDISQFGYEIALTNLGAFYYSMGDNSESLFWTEKAAELDEPSAQVNLGYMYGREPEIADLEKSLYWLNKSIERENPQAYFALGNLYAKGSKVYPIDEKKAWDNYYKAAELGHSSAQLNIANWYLKGHIVKKNEQEALKWYLKSAEENNNVYAMYTLSEIYKYGLETVDKDIDKSNYWLEKAKENGFEP